MGKKVFPVVLVGLAVLCAEVANGQTSVKINFQSRTQGSREVPEGYLPDYGDLFGARGNGYTYGWSANMTGSARDRDIHADQRYDTLNSLRLWSGSGTWEIEVPNGEYDVYIVGGDPGYKDQTCSYIVEGVQVDDPTPYPPGSNFDEYTVGVTVWDGRLTLEAAPGGFYVKICFIHIVDVKVALPVSPANQSAWSSTSVVLEWLAGKGATQHDVYFGQDFNEVTAATPSSGEVYKGRQTAVQYPATGELSVTPGKTYYWRIDEFDGSQTIKGGVSSFTVQVATAFGPSPVDGGLFVDPETVLTWSKGANAAEHLVYFGQSLEGVQNATTASPEYQGSVLGDETTWDPAGTLTLNQVYYWRVDEKDSKGTVHPGQVWTFTTTSRVSGGLKAEYFSSLDLSGDPVLTRTDPQVNFDWGNGSPEPNVVPADGFSVRWSGQVQIPVAGEWTFWTHTDDGVRLWVDEEPMVDNWPVSRPLGWDSNSVYLEAGMHSIRMHYFDVNYGGHIAIARLLWEGPVVSPRQVIPEKAMTPPYAAGNPVPAINAKDVPTDVVLRWAQGDSAAMHDVYFGSSYDEVNAADVTTAGIYRGRQALANLEYRPTESPLGWGKTYYWRIDEVNDLNPAKAWRGGVWHFTTADFVVVDDFEAYTDDRPNRIFETWRDGLPYSDETGMEVAPGNGTGMIVGVDEAPYGPERTIVQGGEQSLPLTYNNADSPFYSETDRTFAQAQDWTTREGHALKTLSLWYRGYPNTTYGSLSYDAGSGQYTMVGSGTDIWNTSDELHYAYQPLPGNAVMTVKVESVENTNDWAKAGIMVRNGLTGDAVNILLIAAPSGRVSFQTRNVAGQATTSQETGAGSVTLPIWLRLTRDGDTFTGEYSTDGSTWSYVLDAAAATSVVTMTGEVYIGLAVTSHVDAETPCTAVFSNVSVQGAASPTFTTSVDIGIQVNQPAALYVGLQGGGTQAVVQHADGPQAVQTGEWTHWQIPLASFANQGVDLTQVQKMIIGTGDRQPGGTGKLFIDNIRLYGE